MELKFDIRGNLNPPKKINLSLSDFQASFVEAFDKNSSRYEIFENFSRYCEDFKKEISPNFKQWINGSFITNRTNPKDIDVVNLVDFEIAHQKLELLQTYFLNKTALKKYKIDAYLVRIYPEGHPDYFKTVSDLLYWEHWFGHTKKNRAKKRFQKGFVEIKFHQK